MSNIVNVTLENAQQILIDSSHDKLVIIDFWADWCEPCKQLMPVLEKLALEYSEQVILAKVNCDELQQLAMQFGVRNMPTVAIMKDGQPIDGFTGVQPESGIREIIEKHLPNESESWFQQAEQFVADQNWSEAYPLLVNAVNEQQDNYQYKFLLADVCIELGRAQEAKQLLESVPLVEQDSVFHSLQSKLDLLNKSMDSTEIQELEKDVADQPEDLESKVKLAVAYNHVHRNEESLNLLFSVLSRDLNFTDARKTYLDIIASLPAGDQLANKYRKKLYALMY